MTDKTRVAIYVQVSASSQESDNQLIPLEEYCEKKEWFLWNEYVDIISGKENERPAFDKLFEDAHLGKFNLILYWDLSRFSGAGTSHTLLKLKELENLGVDWISYQEPYIRSIGPFKDVVISVLASVAKVEAEKISQRTKAGLERAKLAGIKLGRRPIKIDFSRLWDEYGIQESINRTSKVLPYGYGTVHKVISNNIHSQEEWEGLIIKGG